MGTLYPRFIKKSPLLTSTAELRFTSALPAAALFGLLYTAERERYPSVQQLPASNVPPQYAENDPNLRFQAHYRLDREGGGPALQLGPRAISLISEGKSPHIDVAYLEGEFRRVLKVFDGFNVVSSYDRLGLRYINFFEGKNVLDHSTFRMSLEDRNLLSHPTQLRVEIPDGEFTAALNVMSHAQVAFGAPLSLTAPADAKRGSLIDIDVYAEPLKVAAGDRPEQLVAKFVTAHDVAKRLFFKTLTDNFISELEPQE